MLVDLFANAANTTLAASVLAGATTLTVASSTPFPAVTTAAGTRFRVLIDSELFIVTNVSGTTWTVTPGSEGTTAAAHAAAATVTAIATAGSLGGLALKPRYVAATRTAGNVTITSTALVDFDAGTDLIITATAGDVLTIGCGCQAGGANTVSLSFNINTLNGSLVAVNALGGTTALPGWGLRKSDYYVESFSATYTVQAADVFSGQVRLRLQASIDNTGSFVVFASTSIPFRIWAFNYGALVA